VNKLFFFLQALLRYFPFKLGVFLRRLIYPFFFKSFGSNVRIYDAVIIKYPDDIDIGDNVTINQFCYIGGKGGLTIGRNTQIGAGSKITTSGHNFDNPDIPIVQQGLNFDPVRIGEDVWFGFNVVVLAGAVVGKGSILAAGAVVGKVEIEEYSIAGGVPAKVIRSRRST
jgi:acetyltransferase-like isoleucine patch superfamily enzyme